MYGDDVLSWAKRLKKKNGKCYLIEKTKDSYLVCFLDKNKNVKIGFLEDGMYCRYGLSTFGKLTGDSKLDLWQSCRGAVSEDDFIVMLNIRNGTHSYSEFDVLSLKDIKY